MTDIKLTDELFADLLDKIARERAMKKIMGGKKGIIFHDINHLKKQIEAEIGYQYTRMMRANTTDKMMIFYAGVAFLIEFWNCREAISSEYMESVEEFAPTHHKSFEAYLIALMKDYHLEKMILTCGNTYNALAKEEALE
ncbi:MAG: hypothetical protein LBS33_07995 [Streptococcaceae bacterium]|jgi:hypothetical protein|nr:hypothetical protein [Streptococcaceae bacterium]